MAAGEGRAMSPDILWRYVMKNDDRIRKELRRLHQRIDFLSRRKPLSPAQRRKLEMADRVLRNETNWRSPKRRLRVIAAIDDIAAVACEFIESL